MSKRLHQMARERLARERGTVRKDWGGKIAFALVYPNVYPVAMTNLGFLAVYSLLNRQEDVVCERVFYPEPQEREEILRSETPLLSLESQRPLASFSFVAFSLSYENDYPNAATILSLARIPALRRQRSSRHPLVMAGGPATFLNPEPMSELMDFFVLGEAEEVLEEFLCVVRRRKEVSNREEFLEGLLEVKGVYVPSCYEPRYQEDGTLASFEPSGRAPAKVERRWVKDLDRYPTAAAIVTPDTEFAGIYPVEVGRGCCRRCRFCATGFVYQPNRFRSLNSMQPAFAEGIQAGLRIGLVSAALGDYPGLESLCDWILKAGGTIAAPSLRVDTLSDSLLECLRQSGQKTLTLAPEAGSERLRHALNKPFTDESLLEAVDRMAAAGIFGARLYFMVGLPGEEEEDVQAIVDLAKRVRHRFLKAARTWARMGEVTLSVNPFIPKPWSAFQWAPMAAEALLQARLNRIKRALQREPNVFVTHGLAKWAYLQALLSRGDRRVHRFVLAGADTKVNWKQIFRQSSLNPDFFVYRPREKDELFPWDFLEHGVSKEALYREYERGMSCLENPTSMPGL